MKDFTLASGKILKVTIGGFTEGKDLYQAILKEAKGLEVNEHTEIDANLIKNTVCTLLSSKEIEEKIWKLMARCTYDGHKITTLTFDENIEARADYFEIMKIVAEENIAPFLKGLVQKYRAVIGQVLSSFRKQQSEKTATT